MNLLQFMTEIVHSTVQATLVNASGDILYEGQLGNAPARYIKSKVVGFVGFGSANDICVTIE